MIDTLPDERRSDYRGYFSFKVNFKIMAKEEYEEQKELNREFFSPLHQESTLEVIDIKTTVDNAADASLIRYLINMDEKLDQIIELLSKNNNINGLPNHGIGRNISGTGMEIITDKAVEPGQILHSRFLLSKFPFIFMDMFGEVIHANPVSREGQTLYQIGIKFIDLGITDREKIISSVFQREREMIRKRKGQE
jgi:hypothetical protein